MQVVKNLLSIANPVNTIVMNTSAEGVIWQQATGQTLVFLSNSQKCKTIFSSLFCKWNGTFVFRNM